MRPMPESLARTSAQSARSRKAPLAAVAPATPSDRWLAWTLLGVGLPWLAYTRLYFFLHPRHLTFDGGLFMWYFNKPDPFCGGTRTFAWMWRGDVGRAVAVYPLGPLLFVATVALVVYGLYVLVTRRAVQLNLSPAMVRGLLFHRFRSSGTELDRQAGLAWHVSSQARIVSRESPPCRRPVAAHRPAR